MLISHLMQQRETDHTHKTKFLPTISPPFPLEILSNVPSGHPLNMPLSTRQYTLHTDHFNDLLRYEKLYLYQIHKKKKRFAIFIRRVDVHAGRTDQAQALAPTTNLTIFIMSTIMVIIGGFSLRVARRFVFCSFKSRNLIYRCASINKQPSYYQ